MYTQEKQEEFLLLLEPCRQRLSNFARAMTKDSDEAKDVVSEAILRAYENFDKLKKKEAFRSWIFSIASRLHKRKTWRERVFGNYDDHMAENMADPGTSPDTMLDVQVLYESLDKLPEKQKAAVILFEINGFSIEEIKEIQGGSISGVKSRLKRGREQLAKIMRANDDNRILPERVNLNLTKKKNVPMRNDSIRVFNTESTLSLKVINE